MAGWDTSCAECERVERSALVALTKIVPLFIYLFSLVRKMSPRQNVHLNGFRRKEGDVKCATKSHSLGFRMPQKTRRVQASACILSGKNKTSVVLRRAERDHLSTRCVPRTNHPVATVIQS